VFRNAVDCSRNMLIIAPYSHYLFSIGGSFSIRELYRGFTQAEILPSGKAETCENTEFRFLNEYFEPVFNAA